MSRRLLSGKGLFHHAAAAGNPAGPNCVLLLHCDGAQGSTTFTDSSGRGHVMTATYDAGGATPYVDTTHPKFGSGAYYDNAGYLIPDAAADFTFGTADFTIDCWVYLPAAPSSQARIISFTDASGVWNNHPTLFIGTDLTLQYYNGAGPYFVTTNTLPINTWAHVAVVRSSGTVSLYVNGVLGASGNEPGSLSPLDPRGPSIAGQIGQLAYAENGFLDEFRILNGRAAWTANFTPPTAPYTDPPPPTYPQVGGVNPDIYADFTTNTYRGGGNPQATFASWLSALGGTFSRASSATYIDGGVVKTAASNVARIGAQGIRLTGSATNQILQSQNFSISPWGGSSGMTANAGVAPDGTTTATSFIPPSGAATTCYVQQPASGSVPSSNYNVSLFIKPISTARFAYIDVFAGNDAFVWFDLVAGTIGTKDAALTAAITPLANGWFLISAVRNIGSGSVYLSIRLADADNNQNFTGDGVKGVYLWGGQITQTAFQADYIPTTTATVTQAADNLSLPYTQTTFSVLAKVLGQVVDATQNGAIVGVSPGGFPLSVVAPTTTFGTFNGSGFLNAPATAGPLANLHKIMAAGTTSGRSVTCDGSVPNSDASSFPGATPATLSLGFGGGQHSNGNIQQVALWNGLVASAADLQRLTT